MQTKIRKWGNSQGLTLSRAVLTDAGLAVGDEVDVRVSRGQIVVAPSRRIRGRYRLEELVAQMPDDWTPAEADWGGPAGREVW